MDFLKTHVFWILWPDHTQACNRRIDSLHFLCLLALEIAWKKLSFISKYFLYYLTSPHHERFPAPFTLSFLWTGALVAQEHAQAETQGNINSIIFTRLFPSSRELSLSWAATKCNTYYRETQCSLAPSTKCHWKIRIFKTFKISVNPGFVFLSCKSKHMCAQAGITALPTTALAHGQKNPFWQEDTQNCGFLMALPVGCTLAEQTWQRRNLFLIVLLFQAQQNKKPSLIKC